MATLLASYGFLENDHALTVADASGNGRTGVVTGAVAFESGPHANSRALRFTKDGQYVVFGRTGLEPTNGDRGVVAMAWFRSSGATGFGFPIVYKQLTGASTRVGVGLNADGTLFYVARWKDDLHYGYYSSGMHDGNWHHVTVVDGDTEWAFYLDGALLDSGSRTFDQSTSPTWEDHPWTSGYIDELGDSGQFYNVADVRIFAGSMTQSEVQVQMNVPVATQVLPAPMGAWSFDHVSGTTIYDDSGNGSNGTASDVAILTGTDITFTQSGTSGGYGIKQSVDFPRARLEPFLEYTVMAWAMRPGNFGVGDDTVFTKPRNTQSTAVGLYLTSSDLFYVISTRGGAREFANLPITLDANWHHYAVTMNSAGDWVVYQDGQSVGGGNIPPSDVFLVWPDYMWSLGTNIPADLGGNEAGMRVNDFRIFGQALTQSQVQQYMDTTVTPPGRKFRVGTTARAIRLGTVEKFFGGQ